ncbi:MAG: KilA-N domain-containing protein [Bacteroidota bacterium]
MKRLDVDGIQVRIKKVDAEEYFCLTDIAKQVDAKSDMVIQNWMRNATTLDFLGEWEQLYNPDFLLEVFKEYRSQAGTPRFVMTPKRWETKTQAVGVFSKAGRGGGTYAHRDIALEFCSAISARFKLVLIKEFQRLKEDEAKRLDIEWNIRRELSKAHYPMLKEAVLNQLPKTAGKAGFYLADEADLINQLVFGMTAKQWRAKYPNLKGNMRDNATVEQLLLISDLQIVDSLLLKWDCDKGLRTELLEKFAIDLRRHFRESTPVQRIVDIQNRSLK